MKWRKLGLIYAPSGARWWARRAALLPTVEVLDPSVLRVYFASLDEQRFGRIGYIDLDANNPRRILHETSEPILDIGPHGAFDDSGVTPSCVVRVGGVKHLYYIGWQRCERVPYMLFAGLAVEECGTFRKRARVPVLDRTPAEPFSRSAPCVLVDGPVMKMWYWTCERWSVEKGWTHYNTTIRYARSQDGVHWDSEGLLALTPRGPGDYAVGRPWVVRDGGVYRMWYSIRARAAITYRIGYAESRDGVRWTRKDGDVGIAPSERGWDSEMICFPCVVDVAGHRYMFYNGNGHGGTGFGYAALES